MQVKSMGDPKLQGLNTVEEKPHGRRNDESVVSPTSED